MDLLKDVTENVTATNKTITLDLADHKVDGDSKGTVLTIKGGKAGIADVEIDANAPVEYYNLQGVRVEEPAAGLYIRRQGNNVSKVLVK